MQPYRLTLLFAGGQSLQTEESFQDDLEPEEVQKLVEERLLDRGTSAWKTVGHVLAHIGTLSAVAVEPL